MLFTASPRLCASINEYYPKLNEENGQENPLNTGGLYELGNPAFVCFADFLVIMDSRLENPLLPQNRRALGHTHRQGDEKFRVTPRTRARHNAAVPS